MAAPAARRERFELGPGVLIVCELSLLGELGDAAGRSVTLVHDLPYVLQRGVALKRPGVVKPPVIDRPQLVGRYELLQAFERRNMLVVALLCARAPRRLETLIEPVCRRPPAMRACHMNAVPGDLTGRVLALNRDRIDHCILPVQFPQDPVIGASDTFRRKAVAAIGPQEYGGMGPQHVNLGAKAVLRHPVIFLIPLLPFLPLIAAHPT